jgi:uncharacterized protein (DUF2062 family)
VQESEPTGKQREGLRLSKVLARLKRWWAANRLRLMNIADTPHSIALGSAIGIFFGFTPLWSVKTLLSIVVAWICRCNKVAAAIAVTLHDISLPIQPALYYWQYRIGVFVLQGHTSHETAFQHFRVRSYLNWDTFSAVGLPLLVGSLFLAAPSAIVVYFLMRKLVTRARVTRPAG